MAFSAVSTPLELTGGKLGHIRSGGFWLAYHGKMPTGAHLLLGVPDASNAIDVTHQNRNDLIDVHNQARFLALIGNARLWGTEGRCRLFLKAGNSDAVAASNEVTFHCPVKPLVCRPKLGGLTLGIGLDDLRQLTYAADKADGSDGSFLHFRPIDGCYYFQSGTIGGAFEVDNTRRGLVCTSYVAAVWGGIAVVGDDNAITWRGRRIALCTGDPYYCCGPGLTDRPLTEVKNFLEQHKNETLLVGSANHVAVAVRGYVHEFTNRFGKSQGYQCSKINEWQPKDQTWTVGKPTRQV